MSQKTWLLACRQFLTAQTHVAIPGSAVLLTVFLGFLIGACTTANMGLRPTFATAVSGDQVRLDGGPTTVSTAAATVMFIPQVESNTSLQDGLPDLSGLEIYMEKTACEGPCPVYSVSVQGDGVVRYSGKTCVNVVGEQSAEISVEAMQELVKAFYEYDFFSLEDAYVEDVQDIPSVLIRFTRHNEIKQVFVQVYDPGKVPQAFTQIEKTIDKIANTQQWVTQNGKPAPCP
jgi:hypothetical protein